VGLEYVKNALAAGTPLGSSRYSPRPLSRLRGGHPLPNTHTSWRLRRPDSRAFGAQLLWPPNVKCWLRPWLEGHCPNSFSTGDHSARQVWNCLRKKCASEHTTREYHCYKK